MIFTWCKYYSAWEMYFKSFMVFSSPVLLQHDWLQSIFVTPVHFIVEESWNKLNLLATWQHSKWWRILVLHDLFSFKSFWICAKNQKINELRLNLYKTKMKIFHVNYFVIEILEKMQLIFDRDHRSTCKNPVQCLIWWTSTEVMHKGRQTFCLDLFSIFHKTASCSTLYFYLIMQMTSYEKKGFACWFLR